MKVNTSSDVFYENWYSMIYGIDSIKSMKQSYIYFWFLTNNFELNRVFIVIMLKYIEFSAGEI